MMKSNFVISAVLASFAAQSAHAVIVTVNQATPASGAIVADGKSFPVLKQSTQDIDLGDASKTDFVLQLDYRSDTNLPPAAPNVAKVDAWVRFKAAKKGAIKRSRLKDVSVSITSPLLQKKAKAVTCNALVKTGHTGDKVVVDVQPILLSACSTKGSAALDPEKIGSRNIRGRQGMFKNLFSLDAEKAMGQEFVTDFNSKHANLILPKSHKVSLYAQNLMDRIVSQSDLSGDKPEVYVINANVMNAFALPGGYVYVFRGLLEASRSESEVAAVLGHEWAHVVGRHGAENMSRAIRTIVGVNLFDIGLAIFTRTGKAKDYKMVLEAIRPLLSQMMMVGGILHLLQKSRGAELEADTLGTQYSYRAGFEPWGIASMFEVFKMKSGDKKLTSLERMLSTHPEHDTRISRSYDLASFFMPGRAKHVSSSMDYTNALTELGTIPVPTDAETQLAGSAFLEKLTEFTETNVARRAAHQATAEAIQAEIDAGQITESDLTLETDGPDHSHE
ncbi:MAG: M48 family metalloprotease [Bdellovibrionales bacterium]|nr:M48 family metalloprotease [Bdellovibrionales bacterium]